MQKLTAEEFASIKTKGAYRKSGGRNATILSAIGALKEGEHILINKEEWRGKSPPNAILSAPEQIRRWGGKFHCLETLDGKAWVLARNVPKQ